MLDSSSKTQNHFGLRSEMTARTFTLVLWIFLKHQVLVNYAKCFIIIYEIPIMYLILGAIVSSAFKKTSE